MPLHHDQQDRLRSEEESIQESRTFARAAQLRRLLAYLVECAAHNTELSEYQIATGPIRRAERFDPTTDCIVRKSMRRLRDRLDQYYETEGFSRECRIVLPAGSYRPVLRERVKKLAISPRRAAARIQAGAFEAVGFIDSEGWLSAIQDDFLTALIQTSGIEVLVAEPATREIPDFRITGSVFRYANGTYRVRMRAINPVSNHVEWHAETSCSGDSTPEQYSALTGQFSLWATIVTRRSASETIHAA